MLCALTTNDSGRAAVSLVMNRCYETSRRGKTKVTTCVLNWSNWRWSTPSWRYIVTRSAGRLTRRAPPCHEKHASILAVHLTLRKIAIWMSKNCQKLDICLKKLPKIVIIFKKIANNCHFFGKKKPSFFQIFWHSNSNFSEGQIRTIEGQTPRSNDTSTYVHRLIALEICHLQRMKRFEPFADKTFDHWKVVHYHVY